MHPHPGRHSLLWLDGQDGPVVVPRGRGKGWGLLRREAPPGDHLQPPRLRAVPRSGLGAELGRQRGKVGLHSIKICNSLQVWLRDRTFYCFLLLPDTTSRNLSNDHYPRINLAGYGIIFP